MIFRSSVVVLFAAVMIGPANADQAIRCADFLHNANGSWTSLMGGTVLGPNGPVSLHSGEKFARGKPSEANDVAEVLDGMCQSY